METKKALVLGGNGLTGNELLRQLMAHPAYSEIHILGRNDPGLKGEKIHFHAIEMNQIHQHAEFFKVDDVFCCLGTTIKKAQSKENFRKVDFDMIVEAAQATAQYARQFILVSSIGAHTTSGNFYLRTKGETEQAVLAFNIPSVHILRPSLLLGDRKEKRGGEKLATVVMQLIRPLMIGALKKYRGIQVSELAAIMIRLALKNQAGKFIHESPDLEK